MVCKRSEWPITKQEKIGELQGRERTLGRREAEMPRDTEEFRHTVQRKGNHGTWQNVV